MQEYEYENIKPLAAAEDFRGTEGTFTFKCPLSDYTARARVTLTEAKALAAEIEEIKAETSLMESVRGSLQRIFMDVAGSPGKEKSPPAGPASLSEEDKRLMTVEAFKKIAARFCWDAEKDRWISGKVAGNLASGFIRQLESAPVTKDRDVEVLARMLMEVMNADGKISRHEKGFLGEIAAPLYGNIEDLAQQEPLTAADLAKTAAGSSRDTLLMFCWALALTDKDLDETEVERLNEFAEGLGIPPERMEELKRYAQVFLFEQAMDAVYTSLQAALEQKDRMIAFARRIGLPLDDALRIEVRFRKRHSWED